MNQKKEKKDLNIQIGQRIQAARRAAGFTQAYLAEQLNVSDQYVSDLERGVVGASVQTIINICNVLSVSSDYLLLNAPQNTPTSIKRHLGNLSEKELRIIEESMRLMLEAFSVNKES